MMDLHDFIGPNAGYVLELYDRFLQDPAAVDPATRALFEHWSPDALATLIQPPSPPATAPSVSPQVTPQATPTTNPVHSMAASSLAFRIRGRGHLAAHLNPLADDAPGDPGLDMETHNIGPVELAALPASVVEGPIGDSAANALEAINQLRQIYSSTTGYDYGHVQVAAERAWLRDAVESARFRQPLSALAKKSLLVRLTEVEAFERFLGSTFVGQKRFSIEGTDMLVPLLDEIVRGAAGAGSREVVMGMAHRGRLNVLAHVLRKPYGRIFEEFQHAHHGEGPAASDAFNSYGWTGDVKYHLGARGELWEGSEARISLTLAPNPSHLEFINPVVEGMTRAVQDVRDHRGAPRQDEDAALPVIMHGDAAFPGEGVVAETLNLSGLPGYRTGGTIHIIVNNQLGFTTEPSASRSTLYASDLAKGFEIPIVHVNADDPEAVIAVARLAHAYRQTFHKDFMIDLIGYRRQGHNEGDEPAFTQPQMYDRIRSHPTVRQLWAQTLVTEGLVTKEEADSLLQKELAYLQEVKATEHVDVSEQVEEDRLGAANAISVGVSEDRLRAINAALLNWPEGFAPQEKLERLLARRRTALDTPGGIDWGHAESLAFGSILIDGVAIRLSGQDSERGTFSQRHLVLHDYRSQATVTPLQVLPDAEASFAVYNSPLSEIAPLGFEYGYSEHAEHTMVLWEAQFGDFANAAQVITDQFIVAARAKWRQVSGLVLLLPHGAEGQGPEHSSARLERYLQLAASDNVRIVNCTTSAQYFHLLRRQAASISQDAGVRPLIVMTPKSLLRHPQAGSSLSELVSGRFQPVLDDSAAAQHPDDITRLILCSGKVYVDLMASKIYQDVAQSAAVVRVEELYPFPKNELESILATYGRNLREVVWIQEEPKNMGAWSFVGPRLRDLVNRDIPLTYAGREDRASPAAGSAQQHAQEQAEIIARACAGVRPPQLSLKGALHGKK